VFAPPDCSDSRGKSSSSSPYRLRSASDCSWGSLLARSAIVKVMRMLW
jgi:hypothetical protein